MDSNVTLCGNPKYVETYGNILIRAADKFELIYIFLGLYEFILKTVIIIFTFLLCQCVRKHIQI